MFWKISMLCVLAVVSLCSCADKTTPEYTVKEFISAVKNDNQQVISNLLDWERILVQVKGESYADMSPEEVRVEKDRIRRSMLKALHEGELSVIKDIDPVVSESKVVRETYGPKAVVVVKDRRQKGREYSFALSQVEGSWKIFRIIQKPA